MLNKTLGGLNKFVNITKASLNRILPQDDAHPNPKPRSLQKTKESEKLHKTTKNTILAPTGADLPVSQTHLTEFTPEEQAFINLMARANIEFIFDEVERSTRHGRLR